MKANKLAAANRWLLWKRFLPLSVSASVKEYQCDQGLVASGSFVLHNSAVPNENSIATSFLSWLQSWMHPEFPTPTWAKRKASPMTLGALPGTAPLVSAQLLVMMAWLQDLLAKGTSLFNSKIKQSFTRSRHSSNTFVEYCRKPFFVNASTGR